jgi:plasmid stabilization system protein ParE
MAKRYRVNITKKAEEDLQEIWKRIAKNYPLNAARFVEALYARANTLELFPERCPRIRENLFLEKEYRHLLYKKYRIIFSIDGDTVNIIRVVHGARLLLPSYFLQ